jgi:hypothetical protein
MDNQLLIGIISAAAGAVAAVFAEHLVRALIRRGEEKRRQAVMLTFDPVLRAKCLDGAKYNLSLLRTIKEGMFRGPEGYKNAKPLFLLPAPPSVSNTMKAICGKLSPCFDAPTPEMQR